jgi:uncharacterized membrane protein YphA (DoxX/SURF4 family)
MSAAAAVAVVFRATLAPAFAAAAIGKARDLKAFQRTMTALGIPSRLVAPVSYAVVLLEALLGVLFALGVRPLASASAAFALLIGFTAVSVYAAAVGIQVSCNCFGASERELGRHSAMSSLLLAAIAVGYALSARQARGEVGPSLEDLPALIGLVVGVILLGRWFLATWQVAPMIRARRQIEASAEQ